MNIILDGIDASGKSTFAKKLLDNYSFTSIIHSGADDVAAGFDYFQTMLTTRKNTIFDRFHLSEHIFPILYSRQSTLSIKEYRKLNELLISTNTLYVIFLCSDLSIIHKRLKDRGEEDLIPEAEKQQELFYMYAKKFKDDYLRKNKFFYIIDIAEEDAYSKLDNWIELILKNTEKNIYK